MMLGVGSTRGRVSARNIQTISVVVRGGLVLLLVAACSGRSAHQRCPWSSGRRAVAPSNRFGPCWDRVRGNLVSPRDRAACRCRLHPGRPLRVGRTCAVGVTAERWRDPVRKLRPSIGSR